jgi:hypothetical protein
MLRAGGGAAALMAWRTTRQPARASRHAVTVSAFDFTAGAAPAERCNVNLMHSYASRRRRGGAPPAMATPRGAQSPGQIAKRCYRQRERSTPTQGGQHVPRFAQKSVSACLDHLTQGLFPEAVPHQYLAWQLDRMNHFVVEGVRRTHLHPPPASETTRPQATSPVALSLTRSTLAGCQ